MNGKAWDGTTTNHGHFEDVRSAEASRNSAPSGRGHEVWLRHETDAMPFGPNFLYLDQGDRRRAARAAAAVVSVAATVHIVLDGAVAHLDASAKPGRVRRPGAVSRDAPRPERY